MGGVGMAKLTKEERDVIDASVLAALTLAPADIREVSRRAGEAIMVDGARDGRTTKLSLERLERAGKAGRIPGMGWVRTAGKKPAKAKRGPKQTAGEARDISGAARVANAIARAGGQAKRGGA